MKRIHGFTLIELLVVIAVIAVLMAILMPALQKAKEQAQGAVCQGNLKGYTLATALYAQDNNDEFSDSDVCYFRSRDPLPGESANNHIHRRWCNGDVNLRRHPEFAGAFFKYLANVRGLICPTFKKLAQNRSHINDKVQFALGDASGVSHYDPWHNYTQNGYLGPRKSDPQRTGLVQKTLQVKDPANLFVFADEGPFIESSWNNSGLNDTRLYAIFGSQTSKELMKTHKSKFNVRSGPDGNIGRAFSDVIAGFHNAPSGSVVAGKGNCTFADGHVAQVKREDTFIVAWPLK
jgi:prepilin-type N-terminal cleavage/methylation domain-containing protein/prepilin-type processing-associated H-X9-DG protein